ncbi:TIGR04283 family arsenosugar biosynthesis glycosyltransferase [Rhodohalobacter halophilus]|uniref:TIGR04283 family arsenosugar biosynthesis glycosyltransferase n=1 Tax=Rhodohalobacter halophilus TaxID=1812810 RepID=UPI00083F609A|nr:TIGR04283 family arsenosugar biosynthesis glycosyltransferase [Rhodohalobacter halophilus]
MSGRVSVIIPVLNEEKQIGMRFQSLKRLESGLVDEIIVVDGGSSDRTVEEAQRLGAKIVHSKKGRAAQMNAGTKAAEGDVLYFLHADSEPPPGFDKEISEAIEGGYSFGCFRLKFDWNHPLLNFYSWFTRFRLTELRFGDQSLFVGKKVFERAGGFDENLTVMEDQEIYKRLYGCGRFYLSGREVITSARKYIEVGPIKLQIIFSAIWLGYYLGASQKDLVRFYRRCVSP